jgi:hypothetical protein
MPREVELRIESLLQELAPGTTKVELAKLLGVSEGTLRGYIENRWTVLDRTVLERLADFFECEVTSLLRTTHSRFFDPFRTLSAKQRYPTCAYLRRPDADLMRTERPVAYRDNQAIDHVATLLRDCVEGIVADWSRASTPQEFEERLSENCVVVGSPMVNPASEMAICRCFGAKPFDSGQAAQIPFAFRTATAPRAAASSVVEKSTNEKVGIWLKEVGQLVEADAWPREEFRRLRIKKGRDCAVVVVMNHHPVEPLGYVRKLVVLSGFGGVGTEESAKALVDHYRDLEPREVGVPVWGLIEVFYRKPANSTKREILTYNWRRRVGGRSPVEFTEKM